MNDRQELIVLIDKLTGSWKLSEMIAWVKADREDYLQRNPWTRVYE